MDQEFEIPQKDRDFMLDHALEGYNDKEVAYLLRNETDSLLTESKVVEFLNSEEAEEELELRKSIQEKRAEMSRDDLIRKIRDTMDSLDDKRERLKGQDDEIDSNTVQNILKAARQLAELIDVLESKDGGSGDNVVNINKLEQNFDLTKSVKYLPPEDKQSIVEQLEDDDSIEEFAIVRKDEDDEEEDEEDEDAEDSEKEQKVEA